MPPTQPSKQSKLIIVGAGVFGLSTALHLTCRGYGNIHLFDIQPYSQTAYACSEGCDAASCDEIKILRASYGCAKLYQDLAFKAILEWQRWNEYIAATPTDNLPRGLTLEGKLSDRCGFLRLGDQGLDESEVETQKHFPEEIRGTQYRVSDVQRREDAAADGVPGSKIDPFRRLERRLPMDGVLDMTTGFALASRACAFALHLCVKTGVKTHLGPQHVVTSRSRLAAESLASRQSMDRITLQIWSSWPVVAGRPACSRR